MLSVLLVSPILKRRNGCQGVFPETQSLNLWLERCVRIHRVKQGREGAFGIVTVVLILYLMVRGLCETLDSDQDLLKILAVQDINPEQ